ncbi:MAG TPA: tetratricopeptide repeat protein [Terriglobia bacterium]|nr:tetratricopeptide repeat protein [Terriglobia bacterium]
MLRHFLLTTARRADNLACDGAQLRQAPLSACSVFRNKNRWGSFRIVAGVALLASLIGPPPLRGATQAAADPFSTQLAEGIKLLGEGQLLESVRILDGAKQISPQDARPYFYCGMALAQAGRMRDAAYELGEAVHLAPDQLHYRVFQAHVLEQLKQKSAALDALAVFQKEGTAEGLDPAWLRLLADVYYRLELTDPALKILDLCAKRDPTDARIDLYRGQVYVVKGQPDLALASFERSLEKSTQNPQAYFEMGSILYQKNQLLPAKNALLNAVRQDPGKPEYFSKLASVCLAMGDADEAIEYLKRVEASGSAVPEIYYVLARAYRKKGDSSLSAEYTKKFEQVTEAQRNRDAQRLAADRPVAQAQRQLDQGHAAEAQALFEKALSIDPNRWEPNAYLAEMYLSSGDLQKAYPLLGKLQEIDPDSAVGNYLMAQYWFELKNYEQARVHAEKVRLSRPDNSELRVLLGHIYLELGQKQKAREEYAAAVHLAPERADWRELLRKAGGDAQPDESPQP